MKIDKKSKATNTIVAAIEPKRIRVLSALAGSNIFFIWFTKEVKNNVEQIHKRFPPVSQIPFEPIFSLSPGRSVLNENSPKNKPITAQTMNPVILYGLLMLGQHESLSSPDEATCGESDIVVL